MSTSQARRMPVRKAKTDDWVACYDRNGRLVGICKPDAITPITDSGDAPAAKPKAAPTAAPQAAGDTTAMAKARRISELKKGLYGGGTAQEAADLAEALNVAAIRGLALIHGQGPRRG